MADEDEIDILSDFTFDECVFNSRDDFSTSPSRSLAYRAENARWYDGRNSIDDIYPDIPSTSVLSDHTLASTSKDDSIEDKARGKSTYELVGMNVAVISDPFNSRAPIDRRYYGDNMFIDPKLTHTEGILEDEEIPACKEEVVSETPVHEEDNELVTEDDDIVTEDDDDKEKDDEEETSLSSSDSDSCEDDLSRDRSPIKRMWRVGAITHVMSSPRGGRICHGRGRGRVVTTFERVTAKPARNRRSYESRSANINILKSADLLPKPASINGEPLVRIQLTDCDEDVDIL